MFFLSNRQLWEVLDGKCSQEYPVNAGVPQDSIHGFAPFQPYINDLPDVIYDIAIYIDDTTLSSKCDQVSGLWQKLEMDAELESDLEDTMDLGSLSLVGITLIDVHLNLLNLFHFLILEEGLLVIEIDAWFFSNHS